MGELNRQKRQVLRRIQEYINKARQRHGLTFEQHGVVDIYYHPTDILDAYNYVTPRRGVAWVPGTDTLAALEQLRKHHEPHLELIEGLFPPAFHTQLQNLGLVQDQWQYPILTYGMIPDCDQQPLTIAPVPATSPRIATFEAADPNAIGLWLRLHQRTVDASEVIRCWSNIAAGNEVYVLASDDFVIAGGVAISLEPPIAEIHSLRTAELYRKRGIGSALIRTALMYAQKRGCTMIFSVAEDEYQARLERRLGFVDLDRVIMYRYGADLKEKSSAHEQSLAQSAT